MNTWNSSSAGSTGSIKRLAPRELQTTDTNYSNADINTLAQYYQVNLSSGDNYGTQSRYNTNSGPVSNEGVGVYRSRYSDYHKPALPVALDTASQQSPAMAPLMLMPPTMYPAARAIPSHSQVLLTPQQFVRQEPKEVPRSVSSEDYYTRLSGYTASAPNPVPPSKASIQLGGNGVPTSGQLHALAVNGWEQFEFSLKGQVLSKRKAGAASEDFYLFNSSIIEVVPATFEKRQHCFILDVPSQQGRSKIFLSADNIWTLKAWVRALCEEGVAESASTAVDNAFDFWLPMNPIEHTSPTPILQPPIRRYVAIPGERVVEEQILEGVNPTAIFDHLSSLVPKEKASVSDQWFALRSIDEAPWGQTSARVAPPLLPHQRTRQMVSSNGGGVFDFLGSMIPQKAMRGTNNWYAMHEPDAPPQALLAAPPILPHKKQRAATAAATGGGLLNFLNSAVPKEAMRGTEWYAMRSADAEAAVLSIGAGDLSDNAYGHSNSIAADAKKAAAIAAAHALAAEAEAAAALAAEEDKNFHVSKTELRAVFDTLDANHDGHVSHAEFIKGLRKYPKIAQTLGLHSHGLHKQEGADRDEYVRKFVSMDKDGSHTIEFHEMLQHYTPWLVDK